MRNYTVISVEPDLLPQVIRELLAVAADPNLIEVTDDEFGRVIHVHPEVAEVWYQNAITQQTTSASDGEDDS
jgi:hypothetical protein